MASGTAVTVAQVHEMEAVIASDYRDSIAEVRTGGDSDQQSSCREQMSAKSEKYLESAGNACR